jgi:hypothetical protein
MMAAKLYLSEIMIVNVNALLLRMIAAIIFSAPCLWLAGRWLVEEKKAKFSDAAWIVVLGVVVDAVVGVVINRSFAPIVQLVVWLYLVKTYFDTDWVKAFIISIVAVLVAVGVTFAISMLGLSFLSI